ncbi:MAG: hypothetical protein QHC40_06445 [Sphingobium sp.]|nr:hypothetical protein [Sphingobium sp.]
MRENVPTRRPSLALLQLALLVAGALLSSAALAAPASSSVQRHKFAIPAQPLSAALRQLAKQSGVRILFPYEAVAAIRGPRVDGWLTAQEALDRLIADTTLRQTSAGAGVIALIAPTSDRGERSPRSRSTRSDE